MKNNINIIEKQIEDVLKIHIENMEKQQIEEQSIIDNGAMASIFNYLKDNDNEFVWDEDLIYNKKEEANMLSKQINVISNRVLSYFEKNNVLFNFESDNYFLTGFAIFKYNDTILYIEQMSGQGTITGIGILNSNAKKQYNIGDFDKSEIISIEDILANKEFNKTGNIYLDAINDTIDRELTDLIDNYGFEKVMERLQLLKK